MSLAFWLLWIIFMVFVYKVFKRIVKFSQYMDKVNKIPGPKGVPIIGNMLKLVLNSYEEIGNEFLKLVKQQLEAGRSVINLRFGPICKIVLIKGSATEVILKSTKYLEKSSEYQFGKCFVGNGILLSKKQLWEKRRKMINPSFHQGFLKSFLPLFNEKVEILMDIFENVAEKGPFDVEPHLRNCSLDMLCQSIMGVNVDSQRNPNGELVIAHKEIGDIVFNRMYRPWLWPSFIYNLTNMRKDEIKYSKTIRQFSMKVIQERRKYLELCKMQQDGGQENRQEEEEIFGKKQHKATIDILLESTCDGSKLTDEEMIDEVVVQIAAGHETTASAMSFTLLLLGHHPDIQKRVQDELDQILGDPNRPLTYEDINDLKFLDAVLKETFRLFPPIPLIARVLDEDIIIDGYTIPANTSIIFALLAIHRDPEVFPDPDKFDPERFLGSKGRSLSTFEYMPFSAGPRNCIGNKMAQNETKIVLAHILQKYDVISHDKVEDIKLAAGPDIRSLNGIHINLQRRKTTFTERSKARG